MALNNTSTASGGGGGLVIDKDAVRDFYHSNATNFMSFKTAQDKKSPSPIKKSKTPVLETYSSNGTPLLPATEQKLMRQQEDHYEQHVTPGKQQRAAEFAATSPPTKLQPLSYPARLGGNGADVVNASTPPRPSTQHSPLKIKTSPTVIPQQQHHSPSKLKPIGASEKYFQFLKDQQQIHRGNNHLVESISTFTERRREGQAHILKQMATLTDLLHTVEEGTNWGLTSKYDVTQLVRDAQLSLQPTELTSGGPANVEGLEEIGLKLASLYKSYEVEPGSNVDPATVPHDPASFVSHKLFMEQGQRRVHTLAALIRENSHLDATKVARQADTMLIALEESLQARSIESVITPVEERLEYAAFQIDELSKQRIHNMNEGEVHLAEKNTYDLLDVNEQALNEITGKNDTLARLVQEHLVTANVHKKYVAEVDFASTRTKANSMKTRCQKDLSKMFALREKVEEIEAQTAAKVAQDRHQSDQLLQRNHDKLMTIFSKMEELEREMEGLQKERHRELLRRFQEKDKDEHRRVEYSKFCNVVDEHSVPIERTIKSMDTLLHTTDVLEELIGNGFKSLAAWDSDRLEEAKTMKLEGHKQHVEVLRELLGQIGDMTFRKERMIEETDKGIQRAHIEQELQASTFNPNAQRFANIKKRLLTNRQELEDDIAELKQRAASAVDDFAPCEEELHRNNVSFVHPITEQEHRVLALKARAIEARAAAVGMQGDSRLVNDIRELQVEVSEVQGELDRVNEDTAGTVGKSMPLLKSMKKAKGK